jgi:hypothetical protein
MKPYTLMNRNGNKYQSQAPGILGGYRGPNYDWLYGRLDCSSAKSQIKRGKYVAFRVFFADEATAIAAGHRPCGVCMKKEYLRWKAARTP